MNYYLEVLKKYAVFGGRATRAEYWYFALVHFIISVVLSITDYVVLDGMGILVALYAFAIVLPSLAVSVRRLHDIGRTGWWMFISLLPIIGGIVLILFFIKDSDEGQNTYGPNPKV